MPQIFLSYSKKDRAMAEGLARFLADCGYEVWWDYKLVGGQHFRDEIDQQLDSARAVVVLWTPQSIRSDWVLTGFPAFLSMPFKD